MNVYVYPYIGHPIFFSLHRKRSSEFPMDLYSYSLSLSFLQNQLFAQVRAHTAATVLSSSTSALPAITTAAVSTHVGPLSPQITPSGAVAAAQEAAQETANQTLDFEGRPAGARFATHSAGDALVSAVHNAQIGGGKGGALEFSVNFNTSATHSGTGADTGAGAVSTTQQPFVAQPTLALAVSESTPDLRVLTAGGRAARRRPVTNVQMAATGPSQLEPVLRSNNAKSKRPLSADKPKHAPSLFIASGGAFGKAMPETPAPQPKRADSPPGSLLRASGGANKNSKSKLPPEGEKVGPVDLLWLGQTPEAASQLQAIREKVQICFVLVPLFTFFLSHCNLPCLSLTFSSFLLPLSLSLFLSACLSACLPACLSVCLPALSIQIVAHLVKNARQPGPSRARAEPILATAKLKAIKEQGRVVPLKK